MTQAQYSEEHLAKAVRIRQLEEENRKLRQLVAELPFYKVLVQGIWARQQRGDRHKRRLN
jgi:hypothetical protein